MSTAYILLLRQQVTAEQLSQFWDYKIKSSWQHRQILFWDWCQEEWLL